MRSENVVLDAFWFDSGGSFKFNVTKYKGSELFISLCSKSEYKKLVYAKDLCSMNIDDLPEASKIQKTVNNSVTFKGEISKKAKLYPFLGACGQRYPDYDLELSFHNKKSCLDSSVDPALIAKPIFLGFNMVITVLWVVNWVTNMRVKNFMHCYYSISLFSNVLYLLLFSCELYRLQSQIRRQF